MKLPDDDPAGSKHGANVHNKPILVRNIGFL
jgi:hypothetical protein